MVKLMIKLVLLPIWLPFKILGAIIQIAFGFAFVDAVDDVLFGRND